MVGALFIVVSTLPMAVGAHRLWRWVHIEYGGGHTGRGGGRTLTMVVGILIIMVGTLALVAGKMNCQFWPLCHSSSSLRRFRPYYTSSFFPSLLTGKHRAVSSFLVHYTLS